MADEITLQLTEKERAILHGLVSKSLYEYGDHFTLWWQTLDKRGESLKSIFLKTSCSKSKEG